MKSFRNKTIDISIEEGKEYLQKCIKIENPILDIKTIIDKTIIGDSIETMKLLPEKSIDLIIADPPYNLSKDFNGLKFSKKTFFDYEIYTNQWLSLVEPILKESGSIYVCCDWNSSLVIGRVLGNYFKVRNRITWQREKGRGASKNWKNGLEDIWFATKSNNYTFNLDSIKIRKKLLLLIKKMENQKIG